ncbi:MAG: hypothetical protein WC213_05540 [Arenimonas sp.]|jgi:rare lipoprotein A
MNRSGFLGVALLAGLLSTPSLAADCLLPASTQPTPAMSLVAPEMIQPVTSDPFCASAHDVVASFRAQAAALAAAAPGAYVPLTKDDNTPWRFDMSQNGKRMTSVEFDAWMKAKGIRVATGKPGTVTTATQGSTTSTPASSGQ